MRSGENLNQDTSSIEVEKTPSFLGRIGNKALSVFKGIKKTEVGPVNSESYLLSEQVGIPKNANKKARKWYEEVYKSWDESGIDLPYDVGKMVESYVNNPDYVFGVHHSYAINGANYKKDTILHSILEEGLINAGDASSGRIYKDPSVSKTVSMCPDMLIATIQLKGSYKGSTGGVLIAIPSRLVDEHGDIKPGMEKEVYNYNELGNSVLKPEFILGFAQNLGRGSKIEFTPRQELLENYKEEE